LHALCKVAQKKIGKNQGNCEEFQRLGTQKMLGVAMGPTLLESAEDLAKLAIPTRQCPTKPTTN